MSTPRDPAAVVVYRNRLPWRNRIARILWALVYWFLFRPSPLFLCGWRRFLLRCFGARIGHKAIVHPSVKIWAPWNLEMADHACLAFGVDCYCIDQIYLGERAVVSQYASLCTGGHDLDSPETPLITAPIRIERNGWVFAHAFVGPGVTLGEGAVAAAHAVVVKDVEPWMIVGGNPAKVVRKRARFDAGKPAEGAP